MNNNLIFRRLIQLGALFLIGDGVMGLLKPRWHSLLWHFGPELARAATEELAEHPKTARASLFGGGRNRRGTRFLPNARDRIARRSTQLAERSTRADHPIPRSSHTTVTLPFDFRHLTLGHLHLERSVETNDSFPIFPRNRVVTRF